MEKRLEAPICERGNDLIAFLYGEVDEHEARDFERHLRNCVECKLELGAFKQIRESVGAWRQEALGAAPAHSAARSTVAAPAIGRPFEPRKPSAVAAIREFFDLSPLWMKGTIVFASALFCIFSVLAVARLLDNPKPLVANDKLYTEKELQAKIEEALKSTLQDREAQKRPLPPSLAADNDQHVKPPRRGTNRSSERVAANPKVGRGPLTKSEREQLAADLRLIFPQDDTDLDLLGDGINQ